MAAGRAGLPQPGQPARHQPVGGAGAPRRGCHVDVQVRRPPAIGEVVRGGLVPEGCPRHVDQAAGEEGHGPGPEEQSVPPDGLRDALVLPGEPRAVEASCQVADQHPLDHGDEQRIRFQVHIRVQVDGRLGLRVPPQGVRRRPRASAREQLPQRGSVGLREHTDLHHQRPAPRRLPIGFTQSCTFPTPRAWCAGRVTTGCSADMCRARHGLSSPRRRPPVATIAASRQRYCAQRELVAHPGRTGTDHRQTRSRKRVIWRRSRPGSPPARNGRSRTGGARRWAGDEGRRGSPSGRSRWAGRATLRAREATEHHGVAPRVVGERCEATPG